MPEAGAHHPASGSGGPATWATDGKHVQELEHVLAHCMGGGGGGLTTLRPLLSTSTPAWSGGRVGTRLLYTLCCHHHGSEGASFPAAGGGVRGTFRWRPSGLWQGCWDVCRGRLCRLGHGHLFGLGFPLRAGWVLGWRLRTGWLLGCPLAGGFALAWFWAGPLAGGFALAGFWAGFLPACLLRRSSFGRFTGCSSLYMHACVQKGMHAQARSSMHAQAISRLDCLASASSQIDRLFAGAVDASSANHVC